MITYSPHDPKVYENVEVVPFAEHTRRITGTTIAAILGASPFTTALHVWSRIVNNTAQDAPSDYVAKKMRAGIKLESAIMGMYREDTGYVVDYIPEIFGDSTFLSKEKPFIGGTPDAIAYLPDGRKIIVEVKNIGYKVSKQFGEQDAPYYYYLQAMLYCWLFGCDGIQFAYLVDGYDFKTTGIIPRDDESISMMLSAAEKWWDSYVVTSTPPPPQTADDVNALYPESVKAKVVLGDDKVLSALSRYREIKTQISELTEEAELLKDIIAVSLLDAEILASPEDPATPLATYKVIKASRFDAKAFSKDYPELHEQYKRASVSRRIDLR